MQDQNTVLLNSVADACQRLSIKRTKLYQLIYSQKIRPVKLGTRTLIPEAELVRYVDALITEQQESA